MSLPAPPLLVVAESPGQQRRARRVAQRLNVALGEEPRGGGPPWLLRVGERLQLCRRREADGEGGPRPWLLDVDFLDPSFLWRLEHGGGRGQAVARAVGLRAGRPCPTVLDGTAGLGRDAFLLAWLGCRVAALERCAVIALLLQEALERALGDPRLRSRVGGRLSFEHGDALERLRCWRGERPDVVYLDPMHPERRKSALVKQEMRLFRELVGDDPDGAALVPLARSVARQRVVVKRPSGAPPLAAGVSAALRGRTTRFDLYQPVA